MPGSPAFSKQVVVDGKKTVWCAAYEVTLAPRPAGAFEPVSLVSAEGAGILTLLMSLDQPSPAVIAAVEAGRLAGGLRTSS